MRSILLTWAVLAVECIAESFATGNTRMSELFDIHTPTCQAYDQRYGLDAYLAETIKVLDKCLRTFDRLRDEDAGQNMQDPVTRNVKDKRRQTISHADSRLDSWSVARALLGVRSI